MKIAVTGANGYIGYHVVKELLDRGHEVLAVDFAHNRVDPRAIRITADVLNDRRDYFNEWKQPDVVLHFALRDVPVHQSLFHIDDLPKHFHFLKNLTDAGLKQIIVSGSMHDVGYIDGIVHANTPCNPKTLYGISRNALRELLNSYLAGKPVTFQWVRFFYTYGDDANSSGSLFKKILQMDQEGQISFPFTDGKNRYDYIHIAELSRQVASVAEQTDVFGVINCCSGKPISMKERVEEFLKENNLSIKPDFGAFPPRPYDSPCTYGDDSEMQAILKRKRA